LVTVNRARQGDPVVAFDGDGTEWTCTLTSAHKQRAVLRVNETCHAPPRAAEVTLAQALPKGPVMDLIVRKATELGAARLVPIESARTQVHFEGGRSDRKRERWHTIALEAAKQCGNPWLPTIEPVQSFAHFVAGASSEPYDLKLIASLHPGATSLREAFSRGDKPVRRLVWLIGPEGDFTPDEVGLAIDAGFIPVTLGPLVLRCDTAATYALSVVNYELQTS
jgi:16S rRNA (uracil1498-N3)-methyltransferase